MPHASTSRTKLSIIEERIVTAPWLIKVVGDVLKLGSGSPTHMKFDCCAVLFLFPTPTVQ